MKNSDQDIQLTATAMRIAANRADALAATPSGADRLAARLSDSERAEAVGRIAGGLVHDFNNLLGVIVGNLDRVGRLVPADPTASRCVTDAMTATDSAVALVRRLLAFLRQQPLPAQAVGIDPLIAHLKPLLDVAAQGCRITLDLDCDWRCLVDVSQMENAILNLVINARDAMPEGGRLTIATRPITSAAVGVDDAKGDHVALEVRDTGVGMSPEVKARALDPFFTTKTDGLGTGLGLSQVRRFVVESGGSLRLDSEVGRGTAVTLYIPRMVAEAAGEGDR